MDIKQRLAKVRSELEARGISPRAFDRWAGQNGESLPRLQQSTPAAGQVLIVGPIVSGVIASLFDEWQIEHTTAASVRNRLQEISGDVEVRINSPGGEVFEGSAIALLLVEREKAGDAVNAIVEGVAASGAFLVAINCDSIKIGENAMMMAHRASALAEGDRDEMRTTAYLLEKVDNTMAEQLQKRTGMKAKQAQETLQAETWWTGAEAVEAKIADEVIKAMPDKGGAPEAVTRASMISFATLMGQ